MSLSMTSLLFCSCGKVDSLHKHWLQLPFVHTLLSDSGNKIDVVKYFTTYKVEIDGGGITAEQLYPTWPVMVRRSVSFR
jgi:hypothetical protein